MAAVELVVPPVVLVVRVAVTLSVAVPSFSEAMAAVTTAPVFALAVADSVGSADKAYSVKV